MAERDVFLSYDTVASPLYTSPGVALIIVNQNFKTKTTQRKRKGAHEDFRVLKKTFSELGFQIIERFDATDLQILAAVKEVSAMDHSSHANFVMAVSSHGGRRKQLKRPEDRHDHLQDVSQDMMCDSILGVNERRVDVFTLTSHFMENDCPTLKGKPKLFFIQACRGDEVSTEATADESTTASCGQTPDTGNNAGDNYPDIRLPPGIRRLLPCIRRPRGQGPPAEDIPIWRDCLLACSTPPDYLAFHNDRCSWFIRELHNVLLERHGRYDLLTMLTEVNWKVAQLKTKNSRRPEFRGHHTMPWVASMLKKQVWL